MNGVNLGGWLVLERWLTPSIFAGTEAADEYSLCATLGAMAAERLQAHRRSFITERDFVWLQQHGINAVRIPVGYWIFGEAPPYVAAIEYLDWAMEVAARHNIAVLIDLHAAPGSQNGWDHSGRRQIGWGGPGTTGHTLTILERLAGRYGRAKNLWGIEVLNEPHWTIPKDLLATFYEAAYKKIRRYTPNSVAVVCSDAFRPTIWGGTLPGPAFEHVIFDSHLYQTFDDKDKALTMAGHIAKVNNEWRAAIATVQMVHPLIIGEWSAALDPTTTDMTKQSKKQYLAAQQAAFGATAGHFTGRIKKKYQTTGSIALPYNFDMLVACLGIFLFLGRRVPAKRILLHIHCSNLEHFCDVFAFLSNRRYDQYYE
jgi:glucan 1,3-beta-glucosidase